ncbi:MAG TPA: glycoside hydrolase family 9 protein, partial [Thermoanaerobaculia bacterium]
TSKAFPPFIGPQDDHSPQLLIGKSSCAAGDFAAVMAIAARVYKDQKYLDAAKRAFAWLENHPNLTFRNPPDIKTGEYGDRDCSDERLWAAAELWRTSGDEPAHAYFLAHWRRAFVTPADWSHVGALAAWTYVLSGRANGPVRSQIVAATLARADEIVIRARQDPYRIPLRTRDYVWGSNAVAANYGVELLVANAIKPDRAYVEATMEIVHYLLGRNSFAMSWVTGTGTKAVMHPHHRPSATDNIDAPWPGLLAGGPNRHRQDPVLRRMPPGVPPARMYADDQESYASNEVAINWNAPLVFILEGVEAAK